MEMCVLARVTAVWNVGGGLGRMALDACFPPHCAVCEEAVEAAGNLCASCFSQLRQIGRPHCECCGVPFAHALDAGLCAGCVGERPGYDVARSAWVYNEVSGALVTSLKFRDRTAGLDAYAAAMARAGAEVLQGADIIMPVPLHWRRLMHRRYNQSALLMYALAPYVRGAVMDVRNLRRVRHTVPQTRLKGADRLKNVKGAFAVRDESVVRDRVVVVVDDVMTTGATIEACTRALKEAGAREVRVLTLARTLRE